MERVLFWNVDTQVDFIDEDGKLPVPNAKEIRGSLQSIRSFATLNNISVLSTSDWHHYDSEELSKDPDFVNTFPEHCMAGTKGAELIPETMPKDGKWDLIINWDQSLSVHTVDVIERPFDILLRKDKFDFVAGNDNSDRLLKTLRTEFKTVYVFGVAGNVCVNQAVLGLLKYGFEVRVIKEGIANLPGIPDCETDWIEKGAKMVHIKDLGMSIAFESQY